MSFLKLENIYKSFGSGDSRVDVLKDISLDVSKSEFVVLLGPSGSGKSTLLNIIGGIDTPDSGTILIEDRSLSELKDEDIDSLFGSYEEQEESYTSKASFIDNDCIPVYGDAVSSDAFSGRRIHRGLYKSKDGILLNADLNGAANILRKSGADTRRVELSALQEPLILRQSDLNTRIPIKGIAAA